MRCPRRRPPLLSFQRQSLEAAQQRGERRGSNIGWPYDDKEEWSE